MHTLILFTLSFALPGAEELPLVTDVDAQPLKAQARRVAQALDSLGEPLTDARKTSLKKAYAQTDAEKAVVAIQQTLDPLCLAAVNINPESRVKVAPGPAPKELVEQGWRVFLVKVHNEAGVTAPLRVQSKNALPIYKRSTGSKEPAQNHQAVRRGRPLARHPHVRQPAADEKPLRLGAGVPHRAALQPGSRQTRGGHRVSTSGRARRTLAFEMRRRSCSSAKAR